MKSRSIELHDSEVADIASLADKRVTIHFSSAYGHESIGVPGVNRGKGYVQKAELIVDRGIVLGALPSFPVTISEGTVVEDGRESSNMMPIPYEFRGLFDLCIVFITAHTVSVRGAGANLVLHGEAEYVEEFRGRN